MFYLLSCLAKSLDGLERSGRDRRLCHAGSVGSSPSLPLTHRWSNSGRGRKLDHSALEPVQLDRVDHDVEEDDRKNDQGGERDVFLRARHASSSLSRAVRARPRSRFELDIEVLKVFGDMPATTAAEVVATSSSRTGRGRSSPPRPAPARSSCCSAARLLRGLGNDRRARTRLSSAQRGP